MSIFLILASVFCLIILGILFLISPARYRPALKPFLNKYYAHRGLFDNEVIPENSLSAFERAKEKGYGVELDVRLTGDGKVVVFHDPTLERMCGEKITVSDASYTRLSLHPLLGGNEKIPLLSEALEVLGGVTLICEIKAPENKADTKRLCEKTARILKNYNGKYCVHSFSPLVVRWFRKNAPKVVRGQLSAAFKDGAKVKGFSAFAMRHMLINFIGRPDFISYHHADTRAAGFNLTRLMRPGLIAWTVKGEEELNRAEKKFESFIFEGFEPKS